ncbi:MAG: ABC transporter substrate-binding protein [Lachnospiraceae bacterium]|nr:ABC transporter substrate-binding protein [Lachnospiraceae bacterium]
MRKKMIAMLLMTAMTMVLLAGCGSSGSSSTDSSETSEDAEETTSSEETATESNSSTEKQTVKVGVSIPLTSASEAESAENLLGGINAALEYAQDSGMLERWDIELYSEDDAGDPTTGMNAANKLIYTDGIHALLGPVQSTVASVILPVLEEEQIPSIMAVASPALSQQGYTYFFRANYTNNDAIALTMEFFVEDQGYTKIGILTGQNETSEAALEAAEEVLAGYGIEPVVEYFGDSDTDFSSQIISFRDAGCEAIYEFSGIVGGAQQTEQIRQLMGSDVYVVGLSNGQSSFLELISADVANNSGYATCYDPCFEGEIYDTFRSYYANYVDREAVDVSARGYDGMLILITALNSLDENCSVDDEDFGEKLRDAIRAVDYTGVQGEFHYDENGDGLNSISVVEYVDGERVKIK